MLPFQDRRSGSPPVRLEALILILLLCIAGAAEAQEARASAPRRTSALMEIGYFNINVGRQSGQGALSEQFTAPKWGETERFDVRQASRPGDLLDAALGLRVWRGLAIGLGATYIRGANGVEVTGSVPHPIFFDRHRNSTHQPGDLDDTRIGLHLQMGWTIRLASRLDVQLSAGPSLFRMERGRPEIEATEVGPPYDEVQFHVSRATVKKNVPGANVGLDLTYHLIRRLEPGALFWTAGIGVFVRWTTATATFTELEPDQDIDVGGLQASAGLRFRF